MKYFEVDFTITPCSETATDILSALLADCGFETFVPAADGLQAWVQREAFAQDELDATLAAFPMEGVSITYDVQEAPDENWNQEWERTGFQPVAITNDSRRIVFIHDTTHDADDEALYDIRINPCQAFGTGSHQTTRLIIRTLLDMDLHGSRIVDAGTGTGILSIMCSKLGADSILAYDIDEWSVDNANANFRLNGVAGVTTLLGDASVLMTEAAESCDMLIANINRNILLADMASFARVIRSGGRMLLSGFLREDVPMLTDKAESLGFTLSCQSEDEGWVMLLFGKK